MAGISKALVFHHFESKKKLYLSLLEHCFDKAGTEIHVDSISEYPDFFEAIDKLTRLKLDYFRRHPDESRLVYEAYYSPPDELKEDIEERFGQAMLPRNHLLEQLFEKVPLREGVDRKQAYDLVMIVSKHFENQFTAEVPDMAAMDDEYVRKLLDEMNRFCDMIRHGIAK